MIKHRFEKFEMKYGYYLPIEYKEFINKFGGDSQFGSCRFEYPENIIANILRIPGKMDFRLVPFGDIGNGDYYCFYRYGMEIDKYFVGIYLHETSNFVILSSNFKAFLYRCMLDDYFASITHSEDENNIYGVKECFERCRILAREYGFDLQEVTKYRAEFDYHNLMVKVDDGAVQSLCYLGKHFLDKGNYKTALMYLNKAMNVFKDYLAPYYLLGKHLLLQGKLEGYQYFKLALKKSLVLTGFSYWQEDYIEVPEDVHREISLFLEGFLDEDDVLEGKLSNGQDPYNINLRKNMIKKYYKMGKYKQALNECSNALYCAQDDVEVLSLAHQISIDAGEVYVSKIIEQDLKNIQRKMARNR